MRYTFHQIMTTAALRGTTVEEIGLKHVILKLGRLRWRLRLCADGFYHHC